MNIGKCVFAQIVEFLPKSYFERLVINHKDRSAGIAPPYRSHMLVNIFGQLICLVAIIEHDLKLERPVVDVMRILGNSLLVKDLIQELLASMANKADEYDENQMHLDLSFD